MARKNFLTRESEKLWAAADRPNRDHGTAQMYAWAWWKLEQSGVSFTRGDTTAVHVVSRYDATREQCISVMEFYRDVAGRTERVNRQVYRYHAAGRELVASVEIPPHAMPVKDAVAWCWQHQASAVQPDAIAA